MTVGNIYGSMALPVVLIVMLALGPIYIPLRSFRGVFQIYRGACASLTVYNATLPGGPSAHMNAETTTKPDTPRLEVYRRSDVTHAGLQPPNHMFGDCFHFPKYQVGGACLLQMLDFQRWCNTLKHHGSN